MDVVDGDSNVNLAFLVTLGDTRCVCVSEGPSESSFDLSS